MAITESSSGNNGALVTVKILAAGALAAAGCAPGRCAPHRVGAIHYATRSALQLRTQRPLRKPHAPIYSPQPGALAHIAAAVLGGTRRIIALGSCAVHAARYIIA